MISRRQEKFARLIQKELGYIFLTDGKKYFGNAIISVTHIKASPDFGYVKAYLNFLNVGDPDQMIKLIEKHNRDIRKSLANQLKNSVRKVPELSFYYDDTLDYMEKMDEVFKKLHEKESSSAESSEDKKE
ncbi:MAG: 30S ribosome-binding factor RbfA [Bacteroidetes bacterium]|nr:30S ribosome-binding factor RbfA [Bacteroidota bacterium]MBL6962691.1 30S ribosome-binding factor RbfA [Bacteroidota bacterium]